MVVGTYRRSGQPGTMGGVCPAVRRWMAYYGCCDHIFYFLRIGNTKMGKGKTMPKLLIVGDLHLRTRTPRRRKEADFEAVCLGKLKQIVEIGRKRADFVIQVGDFFHHPDPSKGLIAGVIEVLQEQISFEDCPLYWYAIHGQHDLRYHSKEAAKRSALKVLDAAGVLNIVDDDMDAALSGFLFGAPFGQTPPPCPDSGYNVLVSHVMVGDKPLWPGHELTGPEEYVKKNPGFNLYVVGDYHYPFSVKVGDAWVINAGAVLRMTADERDRTRKPKVVLFDTDTNTPTDIYLDVTPEADAFDLDGYTSDKAHEVERADFAAMADALRKSGKTGVNFGENLAKAMDELEIKKGIRDKAWSAYNGREGE